MKNIIRILFVFLLLLVSTNAIRANNTEDNSVDNENNDVTILNEDTTYTLEGNEILVINTGIDTNGYKLSFIGTGTIDLNRQLKVSGKLFIDENIKVIVNNHPILLDGASLINEGIIELDEQDKPLITINDNDPNKITNIKSKTELKTDIEILIDDGNGNYYYYTGSDDYLKEVLLETNDSNIVIISGTLEVNDIGFNNQLVITQGATFIIRGYNKMTHGVSYHFIYLGTHELYVDETHYIDLKAHPIQVSEVSTLDNEDRIHVDNKLVLEANHLGESVELKALSEGKANFVFEEDKTNEKTLLRSGGLEKVILYGDILNSSKPKETPEPSLTPEPSPTPRPSRTPEPEPSETPELERIIPDTYTR